ncbi:S9 family peptidase [Pseudomonas sp. NIBRBAC000502773]|uniref:alpha/beta hydrolase family protein n=1 Tax=Pseudomonas sp. NIBRBAC000502773 TaxID=2590776 RepID=UPI00112FFDAC|nr:alpha/beta hydrolase [Pseudomonas sp. NIBRBAC000502773]QDG60689.1 alpha/beta hydrolase [Pseudomonas sp. NIBRBAC000502773]
MFQYFETNYVWSLAVAAAIEMGGKIGEIDTMCRPLLEVARQGDDAGTQAFMAAWEAGGDNLVALAHEDKAAGRWLSAGDKLNRAAVYFITAERMQAHGYAPRKALYAKFLRTFAEGVELSGENTRRFEIPYDGAHLAGLFTPAEGVTDAAPCLVVINGLDSTKEMVYRAGLFPQLLAKRGIASLFIDQPGTGEALRLHGMTAVVNTELWASPLMDYLQTRCEIDPLRIGLLGVSLGGYYCPRAVAFEPRFALGAVWGANHNWGEMQKRRLSREGERPVPHYWEHVCWVWGASSMEAFMTLAEQVHLNGVMERIKVPFLVSHGEADRQIPLAYAHQSYDQLTNSPDRELKVFTPREGGIHHSSLDNTSNAGAWIADWVAERLGGTTHFG